MAILGGLALFSAGALVAFATATDSWFVYDAKYGDDISVALNRPDQDGFTLDSDGKYLRWIVQSSNLLFLFLTFSLLNSYRLLNRSRGDLFHLIAILTSMLPFLSVMAAFGVKASLSRNESYPFVVVNTTSGGANATVTRYYIGQGDRFTLDHAPRMMCAAAGLVLIFIFCLQYIVSVFSFYFVQKADLQYVNNVPANIDDCTQPPAYNPKTN
jgi:hypothetical protein